MAESRRSVPSDLSAVVVLSDGDTGGGTGAQLRAALREGHISALAALLLIVAAFGITTVLAALLHRYVEIPMMKRFSKPRVKQREPAPAMA